MARLRVGIVLIVLAITTLVLLPVQLIAIRFFPALAARVPMAWQRVAAFCLGLKVTMQGEPSAKRPLMIVSNHVSWLDIVTLGSALPVSFIAKSEVGTWPVVKWLARLQRSVFVDRTRRAMTSASTEAIAGRLRAGDTMVLFAEGTTDDGISVLPFRSALVGAAQEVAGAEASAVVQPVAIVYTALQGIPIGRLRMSDVAWHGDMDLAPHLLGLIGVGAIDAVVVFGTPIPFGPDADRKTVTAAAEAEVRRMVRAARAARGPRRAPILTGAESG
ncbi:1-acyl-sn-glycerol-3-phosphate acyltransferase [Kaistia hirudinis]|uniref:1-acyl-sn-glycerol-3-phosphate acyltransferase n=1 Tax=Kaistia hirudinis TaxID=1293440 RepID=A0A840ALC4_9HYPH|nr:1-acyl-sn-glycerol-3-phosphate acyltransferase [Kaistia hirudinis]MBB3931080.1 1-acyl-sn-glycerol-3-phosphate acyltransferase [Kaistia hirudinis]